MSSGKSGLSWLLFIVMLVVVFFAGLLANSIMERRTEAVIMRKAKVDIANWETRNEVWGEAYPEEFETYKKNDKGDIEDILEENPNVSILFAGYGFAKDYNKPRGHTHAIEDLRNTLRTGGPTDSKPSPMPATCWTCKSPDVPRMMEELAEAGKDGPAEFYKGGKGGGKWDKMGSQIINPIGCGDCHDSETMALKITRPALIDGYKAYTGKDITEATHQEMRSLVCAQCHVEYYFDKNLEGNKKGSPYLVFPWTHGILAEEQEQHLNERGVDGKGHKDWIHAVSKTRMYKVQHPGWELWKLGPHGQRGVSCADCHMPYESRGGMKYSSHHVASPLEYVDKTCQVCHRQPEEELKKSVHDRQDAIAKLSRKAENLLVKAHFETKAAMEQGASDKELINARKLIRESQWRWDFAVASHGASFHAPLQVSGLLGDSIEKSAASRLELSKILAKHGFLGEVVLPDISTKAKAQKVIGLNAEKMKQGKEDFLKNMAPKWDQEAEKRHQSWDKKKGKI